MYILNLHTGSESWWKENGFNCSALYNSTISSITGTTDTQLLDVNGCILHYTYIEIIHACVQCLFCVSIQWCLFSLFVGVFLCLFQIHNLMTICYV